MESPTVCTDQQSLINTNDGPDQTYAILLLIWVNCTHGFWSADGTLIMQMQGGQPLSQMLSKASSTVEDISVQKNYQNFSSVKKLTISQCFGMKRTSPCDGCRHASTVPCQVWLYTNIK